jgi:ketosteroid isomerase-like protein
MKNKAGQLFIILMACVCGPLVSTSTAQDDWTGTQKEVWKNVNDYYAAFARGDAKAYLDYLHPDFEGWNSNSLLTRKKAEVEKMSTAFLKANKVLVYNLKPLSVKVYGKTALVHYLYDMTFEAPDGNKTKLEGRSTDILVKEGNKWLIVGDHNTTQK